MVCGLLLVLMEVEFVFGQTESWTIKLRQEVLRQTNVNPSYLQSIVSMRRGIKFITVISYMMAQFNRPSIYSRY